MKDGKAKPLRPIFFNSFNGQILTLHEKNAPALHVQCLDLPRNIGPAGMSGRITTIDVVLDNPNIIYLGSASGGVWKTENSGNSWTPVFDDQPTQNIGTVAVQQSKYRLGRNRRRKCGRN
jgi:hypothetical protein